jgi:hypothetical protein
VATVADSVRLQVVTRLVGEGGGDQLVADADFDFQVVGRADAVPGPAVEPATGDGVDPAVDVGRLRCQGLERCGPGLFRCWDGFVNQLQAT